MSKRIVTCVEWVCDECGRADGEEYEGAIHYAPDEAMPSEWEVVNCKQVCGSCVEKLACASKGHELSPWAVSYLTPNTELRSCVRCGGAMETRHV